VKREKRPKASATVKKKAPSAKTRAPKTAAKSASGAKAAPNASQVGKSVPSASVAPKQQDSASQKPAAIVRAKAVVTKFLKRPVAKPAVPPVVKQVAPVIESVADARARLRHDTPVDMPGVVIEAPPRQRPYSVTALAKQSGHSSLIDKLNAGEKAHPDGASASETALERLAIIETIEEAYEAWRELIDEHAAIRTRYQQERERLEREGAFLLGAVRAAGQDPSAAQNGGNPNALAQPGGLSSLIADAEAKLNRARSALEEEIAAQEEAFEAAFAKVKAEIRARVERYGEGMKVGLKLLIRPVGATRNILHVERLSPDESVLFLYALQQTIPTRHGFLFDDSTDDVGLSPAPLFPDDGVDLSYTRPDAPALRARVEKPGQQSLPIKGFIPVFVPKPNGADFFRLLQRGAVMEVELEDGPGFRNVLSREEGERFAGHLLRLKLAGKLELEIVAG
jgi:hypothetical protein